MENGSLGIFSTSDGGIVGIDELGRRVILVRGNAAKSSVPVAPDFGCKNFNRMMDYPATTKYHYLNDKKVVRLFDRLVDNEQANIVHLLRQGFMRNLPMDKRAQEWIIDSSWYIQRFRENAGSSLPLEQIYAQTRDFVSPLDDYFYSTEAGQSTLYRLEAVVNSSVEYLLRRLNLGDRTLRVLNLGSGPAYDVIRICKAEQKIREQVRFDCVDNDIWAIERGEAVVKENGLTNVHYHQKNFFRVNFKDLIDYELVIGILCPLGFEEAVRVLKNFVRNLRSGARIMASCVLDNMAERELFSSWLVHSTSPWPLQYRKRGELEAIFKAAGIIWEGSFVESEFSSGKTRNFEIGIGRI